MRAEKKKHGIDFPSYLKTPLAVLFWLGVWFLVCEWVEMELLVPSPRAVLGAFGELLREGEFYLSCLNSLFRVLTGWLAGTAAGAVLGILSHLSSAVRALFQPLLHIVKATPVASFIVLALVLMHSGAVPAFTCALITVPVVWANIAEGLSSPDKKLLEMAECFNMSRKNRIRDIYIPAVKPYFSAAAITAMGLSWKAGIAAEVICSPKNTIVAGISDAKVYLESPQLFAWTITVIVMSVILEKILGRILGKRGKTV